MGSPKTVALAVAILLGSGMLIGTASALPLNGLTGAAAAETGSGLQDVRWVCGPYRCWWRPGPYWGPPPYWGPRPYWGWHHRHWW